MNHDLSSVRMLGLNLKNWVFDISSLRIQAIFFKMSEDRENSKESNSYNIFSLSLYIMCIHYVYKQTHK